jgi:hypothetical protein
MSVKFVYRPFVQHLTVCCHRTLSRIEENTASTRCQHHEFRVEHHAGGRKFIFVADIYCAHFSVIADQTVANVPNVNRTEHSDLGTLPPHSSSPTDQQPCTAQIYCRA